MKKRSLILTMLLFFLITRESFSQANLLVGGTNSYQLVHTFKKDQTGIPLGMVYVKWLKKDVFTSLIILKENKGKMDTIYKVEQNKFYLANHKKDPLSLLAGPAKNFYGYEFSVKADSYIELTTLRNKGTEKLDPILIVWEVKAKRFAIPDQP